MTAASRSIVHDSATPLADVDEVDDAARAFVQASTETDAPIVLAVSGGCDSMVLMHAVAAALAKTSQEPPSKLQVSVATFDHATGPHATRAASLVARSATRLGLAVRRGRASSRAKTEAGWRSARWRFLRGESPPGSIITTAHNRDDQVETIMMRVLRNAGPRGLAGLAAATDVARPFLHLRRDALRSYAASRKIRFVEDPSNASRAHLRNRIRLDLLPAINRLRPRFEEELLELAAAAAEWRKAVDALALGFVSEGADDGVIRVARAELATYDSAALCALWPAIAARALVTLDRRGTLRLAQFTSSGARGARIQLSGGVEVFRHRDSFVVRRGLSSRSAGAELALSGAVDFGDWRFQPVPSPERQIQSAAIPDETLDHGPCVDRDDPWTAELPSDQPLTVRVWIPADRMRARQGGPARRVKRFFSDAQIPGPSRAGWPVVVAGDEIVWIPGVRRSVAASERSGRPVVRYACERNVSGCPKH